MRTWGREADASEEQSEAIQAPPRAQSEGSLLGDRLDPKMAWMPPCQLGVARTGAALAGTRKAEGPALCEGDSTTPAFGALLVT